MIMKNLWTKKNPLLSMWLSGANAMMGSARGIASAQAKRNAASMMTEGAKQAGKFWGSALEAPRTKKKTRSR